MNSKTLKHERSKVSTLRMDEDQKNAQDMDMGRTENQYAEDGHNLVDKQLEQLEDYHFNPDNTKGDPKLYVDVNIGKSGSMERIIVYEGDSADTLATEFCQKHGLINDMQEKLVLLLEQQIAGVLPRIIEGGEEEQEEDDTNLGQSDDKPREEMIQPAILNSINNTHDMSSKIINQEMTPNRFSAGTVELPGSQPPKINLPQ